MNKTILFSPVGGTDPISLSNCRDGSMLHICRVYKPDKVYLYMSKEVIENQEQDKRYTYCLDKLMILQQRSFDYDLIKREELTDVQEFDFFYKEFTEILAELINKMDDTDTLILNVSSGTPAMKSALLVIKTLGEFPCKLIQVITPEKRMNESKHKNYDVEVLWELDEDNSVEFENRCKEIHCPTLSVIKNEEIIKNHLLVYDYQAALDVAQNIPSEYTDKYIEFIKMAYYRLLLNFKEVDKILNSKFDCLPVKEGGARKYFEYALSLDVKLRRKEYADFIRAITPLLFDLFDIVLKKQFKINIEDFCDNTKNGLKWSKAKLFNSDISKVLENNYSNFNYENVYSDHLVKIILYYSDNNSLNKLVEDLRAVEKNIRNLAAHQIISIDDNKIKDLTGFSGKQIMDKIKTMFNYTKMNIKDGYWNSYNDMNSKIINLINEK